MANWLVVSSKATGEVVAEIPIDEGEDFKEAYVKAHEVYPPSEYEITSVGCGPEVSPRSVLLGWRDDLEDAGIIRLPAPASE